MRLADRGLICDTQSRPESERIAFFTSLYVTAAGTIFSTCQLGPGKNSPTSTLRIFRSRDGGRTWFELPFRPATVFNGVPGSFSSGQIVEVESGRLLLLATWYDRSEPTRPLFDPVTEGLLVSKQLKAYSTDEGESWSAWEEIPIPGLKGCSSTGPVLRWSDGAIAFPFESLKQFDDPTPAVPGAWCVVSRDQGKTFGAPVQIARDPANEVFYWDQRLCVGPAPGEFVAMFWTHDIKAKQDRAVHFRHAAVAGTEPADGTPVASGISGQIAAPLRLADGSLLAFVVERERSGTLKLWRSRDDGATWPEALTIYVHAGRAGLSQKSTEIDYVEYWDDMTKWTFGHPAICLLPDGQILLSYYAGVPNCLSTHWARVIL